MVKVTDALLAAVLPYMDRFVTLQDKTTTYDSFGEPVDAWLPVASLIHLQCAFGNKAQRELDSTYIAQYKVERHEVTILIAGYCPQAQPTMRAVDDEGVIYDINQVTFDQTRTVTELLVRRVD